MMKLYFLIIIFYLESAWSENILYIAGLPSPSHHIWNRALAFGLANKGYNVTYFCPDKDKIHPPNFTHIYVEGLYEAFHENNDMLEMAELSEIKLIPEFTEFCHLICNATLRSQGLQQLLNYPPDFKFDGIVMDITAGRCLYPLIERFNYPIVVGVTPFLLPPYIAYNLGNHIYASYIPWYALPYTNNMSFTERFWNYFYMYSEILYKYVVQYQKENDLAKLTFGQDTSSLEQLERHISLVLTNTDPVLDYPQPLAPNFIPVGGLHTRKPKQIPQEFKEIMDKAKSGVIVFSLGSNVRSDSLDKQKQKALLEAFSKLSETVIWKFESDLDNLPKNVIISKWLPQNDILAHPNVKLFIGHGGALSTQETIFHGVPIICVPFFFDQHVNTKNIINRKLGISLDFKKISTEYVLKKIRHVLDNPEYTQNMKKVSEIFRDKIATPLEKGIFWIEHALRHDGVPYLSTPARDLPFYKSSGMDIVAFVVAVVLLLYVIVSKLLRKMISLFSSKNKLKVS